MNSPAIIVEPRCEASSVGARPGSPLPRVALTMGDAAGIGPEVTARAAIDPRVLAACRPLIVGSPDVLSRALRLIGSERLVRRVGVADSMRDADAAEGLDCWDPGTIDAASVPPGALDGRAGEAAYQWLVAAARAALDGSVDAVVTAPLNKAALHLAGRKYPGHTEILAETCGVADFAMMLYLPPGESVRGPHGLGVAHVTLHTSVRSVPNLLSTPRIVETIRLIDGFLRRNGCPSPRIGVCALNPHAGEQGLFGDEEATIIQPAVEAAAREGIVATGPFPADTLLLRASQGEFDGVAAMYHDQGHIALKLLGFHRAVNVTLGLPIVRASPSHGTAFDIAWTGRARADGMIEAIRVACRLAKETAKRR